MSREEEIRAGLFDYALTERAPEVKALTVEALALGIDPMDNLLQSPDPLSLRGRAALREGRRLRSRDADRSALSPSAATSSTRSQATTTTSARSSW
jgi:hypothetical protein